MRTHHYRLFWGFLSLCALLLCTTTSTWAAGTANERTIPISVTTTLKNKGVAAGWAKMHADNPLKVSVYLSFAKPFDAKIDLRGFTAAGVEAARSDELTIKLSEDAGTPVVFTFPQGTDLSKATRLVVAGEDGVHPAPKPQKKDGSFGEEAKEIFQELTR